MMLELKVSGDVHVYHHLGASDPEVLTTLADIIGRLQTLEQAQAAGVDLIVKAVHAGTASTRRHIMGVKQDLDAAMAQIDSYTNQIADRLANLAQQIADQAANGLSATDAQSLSAQINAEVTKLQALAADPQNPVPDTGGTGTDTGTTGTDTGTTGTDTGTGGETPPEPPAGGNQRRR